uniref:mRNA capping enzyme n=1 Tax=Megaviridae environmental sample TaxID=1737588 RepID=A0A5J6VMF2_9VIRU|nr:MAG: mRNA capping enzyme [Megaviridae environmental sample]
MDKYKNYIKKIFDTIKKNDEFEIMFNNYKSDNKLMIHSFMNVMKYLKYRSSTENLNLVSNVSLDIQFSNTLETAYRITINTESMINDFLELVHYKDKYIIFGILLKNFIDKPGYSLIKKVKNKLDIYDINDLDIRIRKSAELPVTDKEKNFLQNLTSDDNNSIIFRLKQRLSLNVDTDLSIDLTIVKMTDKLDQLNSTNKNYELEIDYSPIKPTNEKLELILKEVDIIKKVLIESDHLVTNDLKNKILKKYISLMFNNSNRVTNLYSMQPINAEVQHFIDNIPNKYSITDKADGDKYQVFITDGEMYFISNNLSIKYIKKVSKLKDTVLEAEYIYLPEKKKYLMMVYDCLYFNGIDIRNEIKLEERLNKLKMAIDVIVPKNNFYYIKKLDKNISIKMLKSHYQNEIELYFKNLNSNIDKVKLLVYPKLFMFPVGVSKSEVYLYSTIVWKNCTKNADIKCPYILDGIIYTGIEQKYTKDKKEHKLPIYKFKPPETNSLDVYITFKKNKETNKYMDIFDNSLPDVIKGNTHRVTNLFVGSNVGSKEIPIPFMPDDNNDQAYFPIVNGHVRDVKGNIVQDSTVVELTYDLESVLPHNYRWSILRTRWDKTESVLRDKKKYGNYNDIAIRVWKSMKEAVTIEEVKNLSDPKNYSMQMKLLSSRLNSTIISTQKNQDIYYQKITNLIKKLREFHNWIKSIIIYTYCSPILKNFKDKPKKQKILDIGCGRGGDILKIYHARVGEYVGFDVDYEGIYSSTNGALSRYNYLKKKFPEFGKVTYLQADASTLLKSSEQEKKLPNISEANKKILKQIFDSGKKFDIISSQFVIHYLFSDLLSVKNLIQNIKNVLVKDGYIILTLFDGNLVNSKFVDNKYTAMYTNAEGQRTKLFEIIKKYDGALQDKPGQAIDVHMSWISNDDKYIQEYLVTKELLIKTMQKANCRLVDTDLFSNLYHINKDYFMNVIKYEENVKNKQFYEKVAQFYGNLQGADKVSKEWSFLFRYYVFQKMN